MSVGSLLAGLLVCWFIYGVGPSVSWWESVVVSLSVGEIDSRLDLELDVENQFVRMLENGEDNK